MENGSAVVKSLVTRASDGVEDDRYLCQEVRGGRPCYGGGRLWYGRKCLWYGGGRLWYCVVWRAPCCVVGHPGVGLLVWSRAPWCGGERPGVEKSALR